MKQSFPRFLLALTGFFPLLLTAQPVNDNPCGAIELTVGATPDCIPGNPQSWTGATATPGLPQPFCGSYTTGDVWYKFTLNQPADIFITTQAGVGPGAISDGAMALYAGDCNGGLYYILCNDDSGPGNMPQIELPAQAPGVYYIRFWDYDDKTTGFFNGICVAAQPVPSNTANDDPCNAMELTVANADSCAPGGPLSWSDATMTPGIPPPGCGALLTGDVWFKFTLADTFDVYIDTEPGVGPDGIDDSAMALYRADACDGTMTQLVCNNDYQYPDDEMSRIELLGLPSGLYFIRFWDTDDRTTANFGGICVAAKPTATLPVTNDDPCTAIELTITADSLCTPDNPQSWTGATATAGLPNPVCGSYSTGDVWFKFSQTESFDLFIATVAGAGPGAITDGAMALYLAADDCSGALNLVACDDDSGPGNMPQLQQYVLPAGLYFIRFWDYSDKVSANFGGICVAARPSNSTVANDNCITATTFPPIPANGDCVTLAVNTVGATGAPLNNCNGIADDDVWYSFVMPPGVDRLAFDITQNGSPSQQGLRVYSGSCGQQVSVACFTESSGVIENLVGGQTYYLKTYTIADDGGAAYDLCLQAVIPPANDEPCGATALPTVAAADCVPNTPFSWVTASASPGLPDPGCGSYSSGDVWFTFELAFKADIVIRTAAGSGPGAITDGAMALYRGDDCGELVQIGCNDDADYPNNHMPALQEFALPPGIYYLRFWEYYDLISGNIGGICIAAQPTASTVVNDICVDALPFPAIPTDGSCASVHVNTAGATGGDSPPASYYADDDLWYSFEVPAGVSGLLYEITTNSGNTQHVLGLYDGCGFNAPIDFYFEKQGHLVGLTAGQTYWLRAYTQEFGVASDFNICLKTLPPPPPNDFCDQAIPFPAIPTDGSCASVSVVTQWATESGLNSCSGFEYADVWFSFTVPNGYTSLLTQVAPHPGTNNQQDFELFSGTCSTLVSLGCYGTGIWEPQRLDNLVPGATYYLRAVSFYEDEYPGYDLCLSVPPPPPANDLCPDAIAFPAILPDGNCATVVGKTLGATGDNDDACHGIFDDDVWFTFTVPPGHDKLWVERTAISGAPQVAVVVYSGNCDNLLEVSCQGLYPYINENVMTGLTGGETYLLRAYTSDANVSSEFGLCLRTLPPPPANDLCPDAIAFPTIPSDGTWVTLAGTTLAASEAVDFPACDGYDDDDVWYTFKVPAGADRVVFDAEVLNGFNDYGLQLELFAGPCDNLVFLNCYDDGAGHFGGLTAGAVYSLRLYSSEPFSYAEFTLSLRAASPAPNDFCPDAIVFSPLPDNGACVSRTASTALATGPPGYVCYGSPDDDVWFTFFVPEDRTAVIFDLYRYFGDAVLIQVFSGSCDSLVLQECFFYPYREDISGLQPGAQYWIRAYTNNVGTSAEFEICLAVAPAPPPNDHCADAISITGAPGIFVDPGPQTTAGATASDQPLCAQHNQSSQDGVFASYDVWYQFTTDADGGDATIRVTFDDPPPVEFSFFYLVVQAFEGECGDFTTLACIENEFISFGQSEGFVEVNWYGLTGNTTYYFRVFPIGSSGNYAHVDFTVDAVGSALSPVSGNPETGQSPELDRIRIFPSPATAQVTVRFQSNTDGAARISVLDALGRVVLQQQASIAPGSNDVVVPVQSLAPGLYTVVLETGAGRVAPGRFVKE